MSERILELYIGPQHPGSGHMRFHIKVDGDIIVEAQPNIGYVHRAVEKIAETKKYIQIIPLVERPSLADTANPNLCYILALEKLLGVEPPERASYLRVLLAEMNRIHSHFYGIGILGIMLGSSTAFMWGFADREILIDLCQLLTGARITYSYIIPGGVRRDIPKSFVERALKALRYIEKRLKDYDNLFVENPVTKARLEGVGVLKKEDAIKLGVVGPNLRASGVKYDVRKNAPYCVYDKLDFDMVVLKEGDSYARLRARVLEIKESIKIIRQILKEIPEGPIFAENYYKMIPPKWKDYYSSTGILKFPAIFARLKPSPGEAVARVEGGRGEFFFYVISDGTDKPYRLRMVSPSYRNVILFSHLLKGHRIADIPAIYGSLDYFPPGADR